MLDIQFAFNKVLYGTTASDPRWLTCTNKINNLVGFAISSKYVESFSDESKAQVCFDNAEFLYEISKKKINLTV